MYRILVALPVEKKHMQILKSTSPESEFIFLHEINSIEGMTDGTEQALKKLPVTEQLVQSADIILGNVPAQFIAASEKLVWLQTGSAGVEAYTAPGVLCAKTALTNSSGAYGLAISEHMLGMWLSIIKKLELYRDNQHRAEWKSMGSVKSIYSSTVLVLGMGDIGGEFAKRCKALGAYVIGVRRKDLTKPDFADELHLTEDLDALLPRADLVAITLPGTKQTTGLFDARRIGLCTNGAVILNVGRGTIIDTDALCKALESGKLSGAGLDVTDPEPLPKEHPLWKIPTAVITPHISGFFHLRETHERIISLMVENLRRFEKGENLINEVDFTTGYRKTL